jgi:hypothetical protein
MTTLKVTSAVTTTPVGICPMAKLATPTMSSMMFIGLDSCSLATCHMLGGAWCGSSFGPYRLRRCSTSPASSP